MMGSSYITGLLMIVVAGLFAGSFSVPFNRNREWVWENNWLVWSFIALVAAPWIVAGLPFPILRRFLLRNPVVTCRGIFWTDLGCRCGAFRKGHRPFGGRLEHADYAGTDKCDRDSDAGYFALSGRIVDCFGYSFDGRSFFDSVGNRFLRCCRGTEGPGHSSFRE